MLRSPSHLANGQANRPSTKVSWRDVWRALKLVWQVDHRQTMLLMVTSLSVSVLPPIIFWTIKLLIDTVAGGQLQERTLLLPAVGLASAFAAQSILQNVHGAVLAVLQQRLTQEVRMQISEHAQRLDLRFFEDARFYDTLRRASEEAAFRPGMMLSQLVSISTDMVTTVSMLIVLSNIHWSLTLVVVVSALPQLLYQFVASGKYYGIVNKHTAAFRESAYYNYLLTVGDAAKEIRLFGLGMLFVDRCRERFNRYFEEDRRLRWQRVLGNSAGALFSSVAIIGAAALVLGGASGVAITGGDIYLTIQSALEARNRVQSALGSITMLYESVLFVSNLFELLECEPEIVSPPVPAAVPTRLQEGIVLENVSFTYPGTEVAVLRDINLRIAPGEVIAIVGENGTGKTTLIKLLTRLYDPSQGAITVDGIDLRQFDVGEWRQQIGMLFQDFVRYQLPARENIGIGNIGKLDNTASIIEAAKKSGVHDVLSNLNHGYDAMLGRMFEQGNELSIGQWQKVALARAFMRQSLLVILDEPSAALDAQSERDLFERFRDLTDGSTAVFISHRFSTVRQADRIVVLNGGHITEEGTHTELMERGGLYARMFHLQSEMYR